MWLVMPAIRDSAGLTSVTPPDEFLAQSAHLVLLAIALGALTLGAVGLIRFHRRGVG